MKIATWNVNSIKVRLEHVLAWLEEHQPDVLALQETKSIDENFPLAAIEAAGYHALFTGQKTYNGVALLSRTQGKDIITDFPTFDDPQRRILGATFGQVRILNLYVPNGAVVDSDKYHYKLTWLQHLQHYVQTTMADFPYFILLGDFNIAPSDDDVYDPAAWQGKILVSPPEREALQNIINLGFSDCFRLFEQPAQSFSWWDYRAASFRRNLGVRIDLILANDALQSRCQQCDIDKVPRSLPRPSDHTPVVAVFEV